MVVKKEHILCNPIFTLAQNVGAFHLYIFSCLEFEIELAKLFLYS